jgi:hypothetical protein
MATKVTSAMPIIRAAAVAAVLPGWRIAFSRASRPAAPAMRSAGHPTTEASGGTNRDADIETPRNSTSVPTPIEASRPLTLTPPANMP